MFNKSWIQFSKKTRHCKHKRTVCRKVSFNNNKNLPNILDTHKNRRMISRLLYMYTMEFFIISTLFRHVAIYYIHTASLLYHRELWLNLLSPGFIKTNTIVSGTAATVLLWYLGNSLDGFWKQWRNFMYNDIYIISTINWCALCIQEDQLLVYIYHNQTRSPRRRKQFTDIEISSQLVIVFLLYISLSVLSFC